MSTNATTNCFCLCDKIADKYPDFAQKSGCAAKYATITAIACFVLAMLFFAICLAMNPEFSLANCSFNQVIFYSVALGTSALATITACFLYNINQSHKQKEIKND